jgi:D-lactate dehydrogenase
MNNVVYLVETQVSEWDFFRKNLADFSLRCVDALQGVEGDAKIVSVFIHSRVDAEFLRTHPSVELITTRSTGYDHIDVAECTRLGIAVCNVSSADENTVAEHTFALMLAVARRLQEVREANKQSHFRYETLRALDLRGKTLGVIGTGRVGLRVIHIGLAFGMKVLAHDPYSRSLMAEVLGVRYLDLDDLLAGSDVITLHAPLTRETHHLLDREAFARCKTGVIVINTARGGLIDTGALIEALDQRIILGAGLDVLEDESVMQKEAMRLIADQIIDNMQCATAPEEARIKHPQRIEELQSVMQNQRLLARPNVVFTPHVAFNSVEAVERINEVTVASIRAFLAGKSINVVNSSGSGKGVHVFEDSRELAGVC